MAAFLTWLTQWQTGIDWIDEDHRELAAMLNRLVEVNRHAATQDPNTVGGEVFTVLDALIERTRRHFQVEDAFLREIRFPGYDGHCCEHIMQLAEFADLRRTLGDAGNACLSEETLDGFKRWFFDHVIVADRGFADYYGELVAGSTPVPVAGRTWGAGYRDWAN